jgi:hypothetical protein
MPKSTSNPQEVNPSDRRVFPRSTVIWSAAANGGTREVESIILNVSAGGAKLRVLSILDDRSEITVRIDRAGDFPGKIVWRCGQYIGVRFDAEPEVVAGRLAQAMIVRTEPVGSAFLMGAF